MWGDVLLRIPRLSLSGISYKPFTRKGLIMFQKCVFQKSSGLIKSDVPFRWRKDLCNIAFWISFEVTRSSFVLEYVHVIFCVDSESRSKYDRSEIEVESIPTETFGRSRYLGALGKEATKGCRWFQGHNWLGLDLWPRAVGMDIVQITNIQPRLRWRTAWSLAVMQ
jgi:hypothetical protein